MTQEQGTPGSAYYQTGGVRVEVKAEDGASLDTVGAFMLGVLALGLLLALLRSQGRNRHLVLEIAKLKAK